MRCKMDVIERAIIELREGESPFFSDDELDYYLNIKHPNDFNSAMYEMCLLKAENDSITLPGGLNIPNNQDYWKTLAKKYRKVVLL